MAIENENGMVMPVAPYGNGANDMGGFGGWWMILFVLLLCGGGFWGGNGMNCGGAGNLYPWMNQSNQMQDGFRDQMLNTQIEGIRNGVTTGFGDVQLGIAGLGRQICETGNGITGAVRDGFYGAEIAANQRQMANMQGNFEIQKGIGDLKYTIGNEGCLTRNQSMMNTRDIIDVINNRVQGITDKLCQLEMDGIKAERDAERRANDQLRSENNRLALGNRIDTAVQQEIDGLYNRLSNCPVPTTPVYGRTPIFTCGGGNGCGCNGNGSVI